MGRVPESIARWLNESEPPGHELKHDQNSVQKLASRLYQTAEPLEKSEDQVQSFVYRISEQYNQLESKDTEAQSKINKVSALEKLMADLTGDLKWFKTHIAKNKTLSVVVQFALAIQKTAL